MKYFDAFCNYIEDYILCNKVVLDDKFIYFINYFIYLGNNAISGFF